MERHYDSETSVKSAAQGLTDHQGHEAFTYQIMTININYTLSVDCICIYFSKCVYFRTGLVGNFCINQPSLNPDRRK